MTVESVYFGIDLGTSNSAIAYFLPGGKGMPVDISVIKNWEGSQTTPSVVYFPRGGARPIVGGNALRRWIAEPERTFRWFKRKMGVEHEYRVGDGTERLSPTPQTLSSCVLAYLKDLAEKRLELPQPICTAVLSVPAYFTEAQALDTKRAAELLGFEATLISEPTAAILDYLSTLTRQERMLKEFPTGQGCVAVFDLGAGTFDLSVARIDVRGKRRLPEVKVLASRGLIDLGGYDFDKEIARFALEKTLRENPGHAMLLTLQEAFLEFDRTDSLVGWETDDRRRVNDLMAGAEVAKIDLSNAEIEEIQIQVPIYYPVPVPPVTMTRAEFRAVIEPLLRRMEMRVCSFLEEVQDKSDGQIGAWSDLDKVVPVGGPTLLPEIIELMSRLFAQAPVQGVDRFDAVARGAAILAASRAGESGTIQVKEISSKGYGVYAGSEYIPLLTPGSSLETAGTGRISVPFCLQPGMAVEIGEFDYDGYTGEPKHEWIKTVTYYHPFLYTDDELQLTMKVGDDRQVQVSITEPNTGESLEVVIRPRGDEALEGDALDEDDGSGESSEGDDE